MSWIPYKEVIKLFKQELNIPETTAFHYIEETFSDKIKKRHLGIRRKLYWKEDILKIIERLRLIYQ